jgi:hypothetical protein
MWRVIAVIEVFQQRLQVNLQSNAYEEVLKDPFGDWECYRINDLVNKVANESANCIEPATTEVFIEQNLF